MGTPSLIPPGNGFASSLVVCSPSAGPGFDNGGPCFQKDATAPHRLYGLARHAGGGGRRIQQSVCVDRYGA